MSDDVPIINGNPFKGWTDEQLREYLDQYMENCKDPSHPMYETHKSMELFKNHLRLLGHVGRLQYAWCRHEKVPWLKSFWNESELVQRGRCPDCGIDLMEMD